MTNLITADHSRLHRPMTADDLLSPMLFSAAPSFGPDGEKAINIITDKATRRLIGGSFYGMGGGARGFHTAGDVITETTDGVSLNDIWAEFQETVRIRNAERQVLVDFLSYTVDEPVLTVEQFGGGDDFEEASEFGVPKSMRQTPSYFQMGFPFKWHDTATRFTWEFLSEATAQQVESAHQSVLDADSRLVFGKVMQALFRNTNSTAQIKGNAYNVYAFYNNDGTVPPAYKANTFDGTHTHYLSSGAATVDSGDLDEMQDHLTHHGYESSNGADLVLMVNKAQGDVIRNFRSIANGGTARYDFITAQGQPSLLMPNQPYGLEPGQTRPPAVLRGMKVIGAYGEFTVVEEGFIPAGYMVAFATGGRDNLTNPLGIREHRNTALRGLRLVQGRRDDYPLQEAYYQRGIGVGIAQRGGAVIMRVGVAAYSIPPQYAA
jgi:hypothetical protein